MDKIILQFCSRVLLFCIFLDQPVLRFGMFLSRFKWHCVCIGGAEAMFEPLSENYEDYEWGLAQYFGYGVQACYRGFR